MTTLLYCRRRVKLAGKPHLFTSTPIPPMPTTHPYDLVIGLDRSDRKADLHLIDTRTGNTGKENIATSPEALQDWLARLRQDHPQDRVAMCLEQPATNLIL